MAGYFHVWQLAEEEEEEEDWDEDDDEDEDEDEDDDKDEDENDDEDEDDGTIVESVEGLLEVVREWASSPQGALMVEWRTDDDEDDSD